MSNHVETRVVNSTDVIFFKGSPIEQGYAAPVGSFLIDLNGNCSFKKTGAGDKDWSVDNGPEACTILGDALKQTMTVQT